MADNLRKTGKADRSRVAIGQRHERRYWCRKLKCTPLELSLAKSLARERYGYMSPSPMMIENVIEKTRGELRDLDKIERATARRAASPARARSRRKA